MRAVIFDTETTGLIEPEVIQLAFLELTGLREPPATPVTLTNYKPSKPIEVAAMATHHIIDEDLMCFPRWPGSWAPNELVSYVIGHKVDFDASNVKLPDRFKRICTLALAKFTWPDLANHKLTTLVYHCFGGVSARQMVSNAHNAGCDVELTYAVLRVILNSIEEPVADFEQLWQLSERARVPSRFWFGKHGPKDGKPGALISEVLLGSDWVRYGKWVEENLAKDFDPYQRKALGFR